VGDCKSERCSRWPTQRGTPKKKARGKRARAAQGYALAFGNFAAPQAFVQSSVGQGITGSAPPNGSASPDAQVQSQVGTGFDPSGTFQGSDGRWLMSQR
jgi:hypothetical protein